jgi:hypothetical protein
MFDEVEELLITLYCDLPSTEIKSSIETKIVNIFISVVYNISKDLLNNASIIYHTNLIHSYYSQKLNPLI